jgi:hypothetical protein
MSPHEAATRLVQHLRQRRDGLRLALGLAPPSESELEEAQPAGRFFFSGQDIAKIAAELEKRLPEQAARIVEEAEKLLRGRFDLLGYEDLDFGSPIDWHLDPVSGKRAPLLPWHRVPYLDYGAVGDHKVIWELNRHQHLVTLAKACWLRRDDRYLNALSSQWYDWLAANPYGVGINWASSLEVAFRSLSWLWVLHLLPPSGPAPAQFRRDLVTELGRGARHIERYLSTYFAPNTHLLGEAVALYFVGTLCPQFAAARRWRKLGWNVLIEQAEKQVRSDGLHFEQSTYYHVYALDFFLHAHLLASRNEGPAGNETAPLDKTIERMANALQTLSQAGAAPRFGDDDGGRLFDHARNRTEHLTDPLATCAALFGRADFKAACPQMPEETLWLLGAAGARGYDTLTAAAPRPRTEFFEASGLACMASTEPRAHALIIDAGPQGFGNSGHGHADALSVQLIVEGCHALTDPGAYCYPVERPERNLLRGTAAHNTLDVDGLDQAEPAGPFSWRHLPQVRAERWVEGRGGTLLIASHDGYQRLAAAVTHRRWVVSLGRGLYLIRDVAGGRGSHRLRLSWHLGPEFRPVDVSSLPARTVSGGKAQAGGDKRIPAAQQSAYFRFENPQGIVVDLIGGEFVSHRLTAGPWSAAYGRKAAAPVVYCEKQAALPAEFATAVAVLQPATAAGRLDKLGRIEQAGDTASQSGGLSAYRYTDGNRSVLVLFSDSEGRWHWREWSSDATFLAIETDASGREFRRVFLAGGSFLESSLGRALHCRGKVECWEWLRGTAGEQVYCSNPEAVEQVAIEALAHLSPLGSEPA